MSNNADPRTPNSPRNESTPSGTKFLLTGELRDSDGNLVVDADDSIDPSQWDGIMEMMKTHVQKNLSKVMDVAFGGDHGSGEISFDVDSTLPPMKFTLKSRRSPSKSRLRNMFTRRKRRQLTMTFHSRVV